MLLIPISGHAGHGKDAFAHTLRHALQRRGKRVLFTHYADLLKYICRAFFGWDGKKDEAGRTLLQRVGTDVIRARDPDFWVSWISTILRFFPDAWDVVLIPDARFPNEIDGLRQVGRVVHIRVVRPGFASALTDAQMAHPSETALDDAAADITVLNDGSLLDLDTVAEKIAEDLIDERHY